MKTVEPVITKETTPDGWITTADYGNQGVSTARVHIAQGTPEEAAANRRALDMVLRRYGYKLADN